MERHRKNRRRVGTSPKKLNKDWTRESGGNQLRLFQLLQATPVKRLLQYRNPDITKAIHFSDGHARLPTVGARLSTGHLSHLTRPFIFLAERARASLERGMVILARPLTIKRGALT